MFGSAAARPEHLGLQSGRLRPCPRTSNCVSSEPGTPASQLVAPFPAPAGAGEMARIAAVINAWPRTKIVTTGDGYLHAEFTSLLLRFVDDVELRFDPANGVIHVRSASRIGRSDLGANRKRVEGLRARWAKR